MASNVSRQFQTFVKRGYAAVPQAATCSGKLEVSTLPNKTVVASMGCGAKSLVKVAVAFRAGSRYETPDNYGVSHILRSSSGLSTGHASTFAIQRNIQQIGASLSAVQDRESLVYILESTHENIMTGLELLKKTVIAQEFRPWELSDNVPRILAELATIPPQAKALDLVHRAAFRTGLGNSIFVQPYNVKKIGSETLQHYVSSNLVHGNAAFVGCGLPHGQITSFAESFNLNSGGGSSTSASKYYGGEVRVEDDISLVHTVIAGEAPGLNSEEVLASAVAKFALGARPAVKHGAGSSPLCKLPEGSAASALSIAHSDAGLFGLYVAAPPHLAKQAVEAAVGALKKGVSDEDVSRGKAQLKAAILFAADSCQGVVEDLAGQALLTSCPKSAAQLADEVDKVSSGQVKQVIQKVASGNKSLAVIGKTGYVPYLDEL